MKKTHLFVFAAIITLAIAPCAFAALGSGLVGYWNFDEGTGSTAEDLAGSNDGVLQGTTTWDVGKVGSGSILVNAAGEYVAVPDSAKWTFASGEDFTMNAWILPNDVSGTKTFIGGGGSYELVFGMDVQEHLLFYIGDGVSGWPDIQTESDPGSITYVAWQMVTVIRDGTTITLYHNGSSVSSKNPQSSSIDPTGLFLGNDGTAARYSGLLDEVAIWNRALDVSGGELDELYNGGAGTPAPEPASMIMLGLAGAGIIWKRRKRC